MTTECHSVTMFPAILSLSSFPSSLIRTIVQNFAMYAYEKPSFLSLKFNGPKLLIALFSTVHRRFYIGNEEIFCTGCFDYSESLSILVVFMDERNCDSTKLVDSQRFAMIPDFSFKVVSFFECSRFYVRQLSNLGLLILINLR